MKSARRFDLVQRMTEADAQQWIDLHEAVRSIPGNPYGTEILSFGKATALFVQAVPLTRFNRVVGLGHQDRAALDEIVGFYRLRCVPFRIEINPHSADGELLDHIAQFGFQPISFQTNLFATPIPMAHGGSKRLRIKEVDVSGISSFAQLYDRAYHADGKPSRLTAFRRMAICARASFPQWKFFEGSVDGEASGGAILHVRDGTATLAGGATLPQFRGSGVQTGLIAHRLDEAAHAGCDLVVSRCDAGTVSQRNLERAGLRVAYTKIIYERASPERDRKTLRRTVDVAPSGSRWID